MSSRPDPHAPTTPADPDDHVARAAPVNPGAWDTRSWTLVDATDDRAAESGTEPPGGGSDRNEAPRVVWPEAGQTDAPALDADGVPLAEPPTGPLRSVAGAPEASAPDPLRERPSPVGRRAGRDRTDVRTLDAADVPLAEPPTGPLPRPTSPVAAATDERAVGERVAGERVAGERTAEPLPRRRARATPRTAPRPAPPAPETRLPGPAQEPPGPAPGPRASRAARAGSGGGDGGGRTAVPEADPDTSENARHAPAAARAGLPFADRAPEKGAEEVREARFLGEQAERPPGGAGRRSRGRAAGPDGDGGHPAAPVPGARAPRERAPAGGRERAGHAAATKPATAGSADPVRELMHRHRALCERAVDPLEIAAGLEAHGITDRTAARYRHRDVFSLAEELYVRVPRADAASDGARGTVDGAPRAGVLRTAGRGLSHLLPGALCVATLAGLQHVPQTPPYARPAVGALGALTVLAAVGLSLRGVPRTRTAGLWGCWLLGYVLYGDWLLAQLLSGEGRAERLLPALGSLCAPLAMSFGIAPAAWCAHLFATRARRRLAKSRSLGDFAAGVRPLLLLTVALFAVALLVVQGAAHVVVEGAVPPHATQAATAALGVLLFVALLLSAHGFPRAASAGLASACLMIAAVLGAVLAARLPGAERLAQPVETAVAAWGPTVVPIAACALAALPLLGYALRVLAGASAHQRGAAYPHLPPRQAR